MVLFTSDRPLEQAENLKAVYDAYDGDKEFCIRRKARNLRSYALEVTDELPVDAADKCLFIWHGMGLGKTYGLDQPRPYYTNPRLVTYAISSSAEIVPKVAKMLGLSESQVIPTGMPRTDAYFELEKADTNYRNYLYAPTFRGGNWLPDWKRIQMHPDERLSVKAHPVTGRIVDKRYEQIFEYDPYCPSTLHLTGCDVLITDYSSIMFDAFVMRKPVVLFAKDKNAYLKDRGMYLEYPKMYSNYFCNTEEELMQAVRDVKWNKYFEDLRQLHAGACDGKSTSRVIDLIRSML